MNKNVVDDIVAVNAAQDLVILGKSGGELYRISDGSFVGALPAEEQFDAAAIGSNGVVATSLGGHISFWSIPAFERMGELMIDGNEAIFIAKNGAFETTGDAERWRSRLSCVVGETKQPFERCIDVSYRPGIAATVLGL
jgi:hypothetical protein